MNQIPARVGHKSTGQVLASKSDSIEDQEAVQNTDAKYQEIFYHKYRIRNAIPNDPSRLVPIDLKKALGETMSLWIAGVGWDGNEYAGIVFYNQKNFNSLDVLRICDDLWNLSTPVFVDDERCRFKHTAQTDTRRLADMIGMFFEGDDWYGMAIFKFDSQMFELGYYSEKRKFVPSSTHQIGNYVDQIVF